MRQRHVNAIRQSDMQTTGAHAHTRQFEARRKELGETSIALLLSYVDFRISIASAPRQPVKRCLSGYFLCSTYLQAGHLKVKTTMARCESVKQRSREPSGLKRLMHMP